MAHANNEDSQPRAPQVCSHCKSIKKGCDKKLPSCSQCIKRRAVCRYGEPAEPRRYGDEIAKRSRSPSTASSWTSIPRSVITKLSPSIRLSLLLMNSLSDAIPSDVFDPSLPQTTTTTDSLFHSQVSHIIRADGQYIDDVTSQYFRGIHRWLPIISRKRFHQQLMNIQNVPTADFSILLLCMRLITQHPSADPSKEQDREVLYLATKTLFTQVQAFISSSIYMIQSGVIIACYEHAHGMVEASSISIGTTSRMAFAAGLHNKQCSEELQGSDSWLADEEALSTWWGLVIQDRIIGSELQMRGRPLTTRYTRDDDYLPLESNDLDETTADILEPTFRYFISATSLPGVGTFGREAQAAYLLDKVLQRVEVEVLDETTWWELYHLDRELQALLSTIMEQVSGRWGIYCGATSMTITALYTLHRKMASQHGYSDGANCPQSDEIARIALNGVTRMVIDIAHAFNRECVPDFDIETLAPSMAHIVRSAQQHVLVADDFKNPQWLLDFEELRKMLKYFNRRWSLAGKELHLLNKTVEMTLSMQT